MTKIKRKKSGSLFDYEERMEEIAKKTNPLEKLNKIIEWEMFRGLLNEVFFKEAKGLGGAPHYDYVMMFKILVIQRYYNLSDEQTEFQIKDRLSFQKFLGITLADKAPDQNTIRGFREELTKKKAVKKLFNKFDRYLENKGIMGKKGVILDASFIEAPKQRNTREENKEIKEGKIPEEWENDPNKLSQKDIDAMWTIKNGEKHYGYKDHISADKKTKLIKDYETTPANVHDSQVIENLISNEKSGTEVYGDSAYSGNNINEILKKNNLNSKIHEKGYRNKALTKEQKEKNREKSKTRARVEHVFGFIENTMKGSYIRTIGKERANTMIGLVNLVYNMCRYQQLIKFGLVNEG